MKTGVLAMTSLPVTHHTSRAVTSAIPTGSKSAGRVHAVITDPNLFIVAAVGAIGLLVTLNLIFRFAIFGSSVEQIADILG
jgi:hypothetical protein